MSQLIEARNTHPVTGDLETTGYNSAHELGASPMINQAIHLVSEAITINDLRRAEIVFQNAGILAAREALSYGVEIKGWQGSLGKYRLPEVWEGDDEAWFSSYKLSQLDQLPDEYQLLANLADTYELRRIRQTGSNLITPDREVRFATARVEEARRVLEKEEALLALHLQDLQASLEK